MNSEAIKRRARAIIAHAKRAGGDVPNPYEALVVAKHFMFGDLARVTFERCSPGRYNIRFGPIPGIEEEWNEGGMQSAPNIFASICPGDDPEEHMIKAELVRALSRAIEDRMLSRPKAAELLGVTVDELKRMFRGSGLRTRRIEELVVMLLKLGYEPKMTVPGLEHIEERRRERAKERMAAEEAKYRAETPEAEEVT